MSLARIKLDAFHALQRITRTLKTKHGAFGSFCKDLRDALFGISKTSFDQEVERLKETKAFQGDDGSAIEDFIASTYSHFVKKCVRGISSPSDLEASNSLTTWSSPIL